MTGDVPAVDVPGAFSGHRLPQFLVKGAQLLAGQQFPLTQQGMNGAHGVVRGGLVQKSFLSGDNGEGDLGELAAFFSKTEGGRLHARVEYKDIGIGLVPLPVRTQFFARRVGGAGVGQQVVVVAGKFLRGKRPMVPGGSRHQRGQHGKDNYGRIAAHIAHDPQHAALLLKEGGPAAGGVGPALVIQGPGLGYLMAAPLKGQDRGDQGDQRDHQAQAKNHHPAGTPQGIQKTKVAAVRAGQLETKQSLARGGAEKVEKGRLQYTHQAQRHGDICHIQPERRG